MPSNAQNAGSIPGQGAKIPHASRPTNKIQNRSNTLTNSIKTLKMVHKKNLKKLSGRQRAMQENKKCRGHGNIKKNDKHFRKIWEYTISMKQEQRAILNKNM